MSDGVERWNGRVALVTGASSGIGRAIAIELGRLGLKVAVSGRNQSALGETVDAIRKAGCESLALSGDIRSPEVVRGLFKSVDASMGPLDLLVSSAGMLGGRSLLEEDWDAIEAAIDVNVRAVVLCMREAAIRMRDKSEAAIINISSMTGHRVVPGTPALYAATKHALRILTDGVRNELAQAGSKVKVSLLSPGLVDTPWHEKPGGLLKASGAYPYTPLQSADIVAAVRYVLASPPGVQVCDIQLRPSGQTF